MKRSAVVAALVLVSAALGTSATLVFRAHSAAPKSTGVRAAHVGAAASSSGVEAEPWSRAGWEVGTEYVHSLEYHVTVGQESEAREPGQTLNLRARGELHSLVWEHAGQRTKVQYALASARLESPVANQAAANGMKLTESALAQPFAVEYDASGRALELFVKPDLDVIALGILRELIASTQLSLPSAHTPRWSALETDATGEYRADYSQTTALTLQRQKTEYVRVAGAAGLHEAGKAGPRIRAALAQFRLDDWGRTADLESHSEVVTPPALDGGGPVFVAATDLRLRFLSRVTAANTRPLALPSLQATSLAPDARDFARAANDTERALVGSATSKELLSELERLAPDDNQAASNVQVRLSALVRQHPNEIAPLLAHLNAKNAATVLGALGSAGTPEAQKALADVTRDASRGGDVRQAAVDSMLTLEHPTRDVPEALQAAMHSDDPSLRNNSSLMLGVMSRRLAEDEPEKASAVNHELVSELAQATDTSDRIRLLGSLGNSGAAEGLPQIAQALKSPDPAVRAQAASSLRFVKDLQADALLSQVIVADPVLMVRSAALSAAGFRSYEPLSGALQSAAKDAEASLRAQLVTTLISLAADSGDALVLLDHIAQSDPNKDVRDQAKRALDHATTLAQNR